MSKLFVIPTPVGNLEDITLRAIRLLKEVDLILAEDTRTTQILLKHYDIHNRIYSHHKFNEHQTVERFTALIEAGQSIALVSDAGTPSISDPGFLLVRACIQKNIEVECLPGAVAFIPALVVSGLPSDRFYFEGFLPVKKGRRSRLLEIASDERTAVFYESPYRLLKTLVQLSETCGLNRLVSVSRELSKRFEETIRGTLEEVIRHFTTTKPKGEFVIVLQGNVGG